MMARRVHAEILWLHRRVACLPAEFRQDRLPNPHRTGKGVSALRILPAKRVSLHLAEQQSQLPSGQSKSTCQDHTPRTEPLWMWHRWVCTPVHLGGYIPTLSIPGAADMCAGVFTLVSRYIVSHYIVLLVLFASGPLFASAGCFLDLCCPVEHLKDASN